VCSARSEPTELALRADERSRSRAICWDSQSSFRLGYHNLVINAEFEAAIVARRIDIQALCAEARRLESQSGNTSELFVTIPAGWLPALAEGLDLVIYNCEQDKIDERTSGQTDGDCSVDPEHLERMRSLLSAIRDVEPGSAYTVSTGDREALWNGMGCACFLQESQLRAMHEDTDPLILRFVATEQLEALVSFTSALDEFLRQAEGVMDAKIS
jgi:hypothetical protein